MKRILLKLMLLTLVGCGTDAPIDHPSHDAVNCAPAVLLRAHSHNDYTRRRPLQEALDLKFGSVEADVFLVNGDLLVAHDREQCRPERTLDAMYLAPLVARAGENGGAIYPGEPEPLILLVDLKAGGADAYRALHEKLAAAPNVFTEFDRGVVYPRAVTVVVSGDTPRALIAAQAQRFAFVDGRGGDLEGAVDNTPGPGLTPLVSMAWRSQFKWFGLGEMPPVEQEKLKSLVNEAHARGYKIRFWGIPNLEHVWRELYDAGVDLINVDDLPRAAEVLRELRQPRPIR